MILVGCIIRWRGDEWYDEVHERANEEGDRSEKSQYKAGIIRREKLEAESHDQMASHMEKCGYKKGDPGRDDDGAHRSMLVTCKPMRLVSPI